MRSEVDVEVAYQAWRTANKRYRTQDYGPTESVIHAEEDAWDRFRDACDEVNGGGPCSHPECPPDEPNDGASS